MKLGIDKSPVILYDVGEKHPMARLTEKDVREIRALYGTTKYTLKELGKRFGVHRGHIGDIVRRKSWKHI